MKQITNKQTNNFYSVKKKYKRTLQSLERQNNKNSGILNGTNKIEA